MKRLFRQILSNKKLLAFIAVIFAVGAGIAANMIHAILQNMEKAAQPDNSPQWYPPYPPLRPAASPDRQKQIARGELLVKAGDCVACHTDTHNKGASFAGGLPMQTPFGVIYTPNITPDPDTGIGKWTDEQFIKAMKKGISPQGQYYYPAFPYPYFARMPDADIKAIKAYLEAIPPVRQANLENEMVWPFSLRIMQLPWRILFFHPSDKDVFPEVAATPLEWGAYLVEGPGHCGMCHTPSWHILTEDLPLGAPIKKYHLAGAKVAGFYAPNISNANLGNVPDSEIVQVFTEDKLIGGGNVVGPMLEVNHDSLRWLSIDDLTAIAQYLKSVKSTPLPKASGSGGKGTYEANCAGCHAAGAGGAPRFGDAAAWSPILTLGKETIYKNAIQGINGMPAKGACITCTDDEIKQAVDYMLVPVEGAKASALPPPQKPLTMADGERIYNENCSICHAVGFHNAPKLGDAAAFQSAAKAGFLNTYLDVITGRKGHPARGACENCSDADIKAAVKYMMQQSVPGKNYSLW